MTNAIFVAVLSIALFLLMYWGFRTLPGEEWQVLASIPLNKGDDGLWEGFNLTFYGFFNASACTFSIAIVWVLLGCLALPSTITVIVTGIIFGVSFFASRMIARWVEKKPATSTIGGAAFAGLMIAPWAILLTGFFEKGSIHAISVSIIPMLAAYAIAYTFGEGIGRLACISFGCCYGKPLSDCHPLIRTLFKNHCFVFRGVTKKIAYASRLDRQEVIPIQAVTATIHLIAGLFALSLFLDGHLRTAFMIAIAMTQLWRFLSEFLRADYRGGAGISAYQIMALIALGYALLLLILAPTSPCRPLESPRASNGYGIHLPFYSFSSYGLSSSG